MGNVFRSVLASGGSTPTSITPSDSSPASMTAGTTYEPTANGYAIESNPSSITPSNSSPAALTSGNIYKAGGAGYAIQSYSSVTPTSSPTSLSSGSIYKMGGAGYAINSYSSSSKSPTSSGAYFSSGWNYMNSSGYAYSSQPTLYSLVTAATVKNAGTGSSAQSFSATSGKKYLVVAFRYSSSAAADCGISSGATVVTTYVNNVAVSGGKAKLWAAIVQATSSTVTLLGTGNGACYMQLD